MIGVTVQMTSTWFYYRETSSTYPQYCLVLHFNLKFCILFVVFHTSTLVLFLNEYQISTFPLDLHLPGFTTGRLPQLEQCILSTVQCYTSTSNFVGHMEKEEAEMKQKLETEMGTKKKHTQSLVQCFLHSVLSHYSCILHSNGYRTGFMSHVLCSCAVLYDYCL